MRCKQNDIEFLNNSRSWITFAECVLSVPDLTGNKYLFVLNFQKFNGSKKKAASRVKTKTQQNQPQLQVANHI